MGSIMTGGTLEQTMLRCRTVDREVSGESEKAKRVVMETLWGSVSNGES
jgi:hypothetical protein